jgi:hypothetical protein
MEWENNTAAAASLFCNGNLNIPGAYTGSGSGLSGIPYSALPYAPVPLATSTPLLITNSESQAVTAAPHTDSSLLRRHVATAVSNSLRNSLTTARYTSKALYRSFAQRMRQTKTAVFLSRVS